MKPQRLIMPLAILGLLSAEAAHAQGAWMPVTAQVRETDTILSKAGVQVSTEVKDGNFYRNSDGSTLEYWTAIDGDRARAGSGKLADNVSVLEYTVNVNTKVAVQMPSIKGEKALQPDFLAGAKTSKLGQDSVEGIVCYYTRVTLTERGKPSREIGKACQSPDYGLTLKVATRIVSPDGQVYLRTRELHDIRLGEKPDAKLFQLRPTFQILHPE